MVGSLTAVCTPRPRFICFFENQSKLPWSRSPHDDSPSLAVGHSRLVWRDGWKHRGSPSDTHTVHCERVGRVAQFRLKKTSLKVRIVSEAGNRLDSRLRVQKDRPRILRGMAGRNCAQMYGKRGWKWGGIEGILWFAAGP